jgi:hypothetical protein
MPGMIFDITGGYEWAIWLSAAFSLFGAFSIVLLEPTMKLLIPRWEDVERTEEPADSPVPATAPLGGSD